MVSVQKSEQNGSVTNHQVVEAVTTENIPCRHPVEGSTSKHLTPPDGGYGWVVLIASFFCSVIIDGVCFRSAQNKINYNK